MIKRGDMVKIIRNTAKEIPEMQEMLGRVCEVKRELQMNGFEIWNTAKTDYWIFHKNHLEKIEGENK